MEKGSEGDNSRGVVGVVFGILSILFAVMIVIGPIMGVIGLVFSISQGKRNKNSWSKAGLILSVVGIVLGVIAIIAVFVFLAWLGELAACVQDPTQPGCEAVKLQLELMQQQAQQQVMENMQSQFSQNPNVAGIGG